MKIVVAFDSFKGSLSAQDAVNTVSKAIKEVSPSANIVKLPLADGGEGTTEILAYYLNASWTKCKVHDALMRPIICKSLSSTHPANATTGILACFATLSTAKGNFPQSV